MVNGIARVLALQGIARPTASAANPGVILRERYPVTMLSLRGSGDQAFSSRAQAALGCELPCVSNSSCTTDEGEILRLAPAEWLVVTGTPSRWSEAITIEGATLTDISHARAVILARGDRVRDVLSKGCLIDLHPRQFPPGMCVQTSIARIGVILHRVQNGSEFALYVPRSYIGSFWHWLTGSAAEYGYHFVRN